MATDSFKLRRPWLKNRPWDVIVFLNEDLCRKGNAQHGKTSDGYEKTKVFWEAEFAKEMDIRDAIDVCLKCHRSAPFLNFNGNTFAAVARQFCQSAVEELDRAQQKAFISTVGHYVAGITSASELENALRSVSIALEKSKK